MLALIDGIHSETNFKLIYNVLLKGNWLLSKTEKEIFKLIEEIISRYNFKFDHEFLPTSALSIVRGYNSKGLVVSLSKTLLGEIPKFLFFIHIFS